MRNIALIVFGYGAAVAVAALVTVLEMYGWAVATGEGSATSGPEFVSSAFVVGVFWTFICAWPGFVVFVVVAARLRWRGWVSSAAAGAVNVVPSLALFSGLAGSPWEFPGMVPACFPGGLAGGAAYWLAAGRWISHLRGGRLA